MNQKEKIIEINDYQLAQNFFGHNDRNLKLLEDILSLKLNGRGNQIKIKNDDQINDSEKIIKKLLSLTNKNEELSPRKLRYAAELLKRNPAEI